MKIAVMGSKNFTNKGLILERLKKDILPTDKVLIGGHEGVYGLAEEYCKKENISLEIIDPINEDMIFQIFIRMLKSLPWQIK